MGFELVFYQKKKAYCSQLITGQTAYWHRVVYERMGYPQPPTILFGDNTTVIGIATDSIKVKRSKPMDIR